MYMSMRTRWLLRTVCERQLRMHQPTRALVAPKYEKARDACKILVGFRNQCRISVTVKCFVTQCFAGAFVSLWFSRWCIMEDPPDGGPSSLAPSTNTGTASSLSDPGAAHARGSAPAPGGAPLSSLVWRGLWVPHKCHISQYDIAIYIWCALLHKR
jgi:hypothetical protein